MAELKTNQSGNVFLIILIAVGLLAAVTIMISRSGSNVEQSGDVEQNRIKISQIQRYAKAVEVGIQRLMLNGCSENEISFENNVDADYINPKSPTDQSCHIFGPEGAGLEWREFSGGELISAGHNLAFVYNIAIEGVETDAGVAGNDLLFVTRISQSLCAQINKELGIATAAAGITAGIDEWNDAYKGRFVSTTVVLGVSSGRAAAVQGHHAGCVIDDGGDYVYYHVLLAR